jgi:hypothetical protein
MADNKDLMTAHFKNVPQPDPVASKKEGRPVFKDFVICEVRAAANKMTVWHFPHDEICGWVETEHGREPESYMMRYSDQYKKFLAGEAQSMSGTPLEELPFLTQSKRMELKALNIYTAEALSMLDGQNLKLLGIGGRELKNQAIAYLDKAAGTADVTKLASDNALMKDTIEQMQKQIAAMQAGPITSAPTQSAFDEWEDTDLKDHIEKATGQRPRGNPSHSTLVRMADELEQAAA